MEGIFPKLEKRYEDIYLIRNEREIRIFDFNSGNAFEPDYLLFMRKKEPNSVYENMQIFIEPKGGHLREHDEWKELFLKRLKDESLITFKTETKYFKIYGMPFFTYQNRKVFDSAMIEEFEYN